MAVAKSQWSPWVATAVVFIATGLVGAFGVWSWRYVDSKEEKKHEKESPSYFVTAGPALRTSERDRVTELVAANYEKDHFRIIPLNLSIYVQITNLQNKPRIIEKLGAEIKTEDGKWIKLIRVYGNFDIYVINPMQSDLGLKDAHLAEVDRLENVLSQAVEPQKNVQGWSFFEYPKGPGSDRFSRTYRLTISDDSGKVFMSDEMTPTEDMNNEAVQGGKLRAIKKVDLSGAVIRHMKD